MNTTGIHQKTEWGLETVAADGKKWAVVPITNREEIIRRLTELRLQGRKIKFITVDGAMSFVREQIEKYCHAKYANIKPQAILERTVEIEAPMIIWFEDGDTLEIYASKKNEFQICMNQAFCYDIVEETKTNVDATVLFSLCMGQRLANFQVESHSDSTTTVTFELENRVGLRVIPTETFCKVECIDQTGHVLPISFSDLEPGLYNWEDIHCDEELGFMAKSKTLFFGEKGEFCVAKPAITIWAKGSAGYYIRMFVEDFAVLEWSMVNLVHGEITFFSETNWARVNEIDPPWPVTKDYFGLEVSTKEWENILSNAERLLAIETYEELSDELISSVDKNTESRELATELAVCKDRFITDKNSFIEQVDDMREWSRLTLSDGSGIRLSPFKEKCGDGQNETDSSQSWLQFSDYLKHRRIPGIINS